MRVMESQIELPYDDLKQEIINIIKNHQVMVLATVNGDKVSARNVLCWSDNLTLYSSSGGNKRKIWQISANPNVALAAGNIQIEGTAVLRGHPFDERNNEIIDDLKQNNQNLYKRAYGAWAARPDYELIEISPTRIALWKSGDPQSYTDILNINRMKAHRVLTRDTGESYAYKE